MKTVSKLIGYYETLLFWQSDIYKRKLSWQKESCFVKGMFPPRLQSCSCKAALYIHVFASRGCHNLRNRPTNVSLPLFILIGGLRHALKQGFTNLLLSSLTFLVPGKNLNLWLCRGCASSAMFPVLSGQKYRSDMASSAITWSVTFLHGPGWKLQ